jgi:hypothetical protein
VLPVLEEVCEEVRDYLFFAVLVDADCFEDFGRIVESLLIVDDDVDLGGGKGTVEGVQVLSTNSYILSYFFALRRLLFLNFPISYSLILCLSLLSDKILLLDIYKELGLIIYLKITYICSILMFNVFQRLNDIEFGRIKGYLENNLNFIRPFIKKNK